MPVGKPGLFHAMLGELIVAGPTPEPVYQGARGCEALAGGAEGRLRGWC